MELLTDTAALWGAVLSTILAWIEYRRGRPATKVSIDSFAAKGLVKVTITNGGNDDVAVVGTRTLLAGDGKVIPPDDQTLLFGSQPGWLLPAGESRTFRFSVEERYVQRWYCFGVIYWKRLSGLSTPTVPIIFRLPFEVIRRLESR